MTTQLEVRFINRDAYYRAKPSQAEGWGYEGESDRRGLAPFGADFFCREDDPEWYYTVATPDHGSVTGTTRDTSLADLVATNRHTGEVWILAEAKPAGRLIEAMDKLDKCQNPDVVAQQVADLIQ